MVHAGTDVRGGRGLYFRFQVAEVSSLFCCFTVSFTCDAILRIGVLLEHGAASVLVFGFSTSTVPEKVEISRQVDSGSFFFDVEQVAC